MIGVEPIERVAALSVLFAQFLYGGHHHHVLYPVALVKNQFGRVLRPHIDAVTLFASLLQGRSVDAIGTAVVLPGKVILALREDTAVAHRLVGLWRTATDGKGLRALRTDASLDEHLAVGRQLIGHFQSGHVADYKLTTARQVQLFEDGIGGQFHNLFTVFIRLVLDSN